jgi:glutathionyl-hydroquinone reductase
VRPASAFRGFVTADGSSGFPAEDRRYHLYAALSCPWAHRALIMRAAKSDFDAVMAVHPTAAEELVTTRQPTLQHGIEPAAA